MITPCIVLAVLVFIVFWLPPEAGEKISLAMTILLSFSVFLLMIAENMLVANFLSMTVEILLYFQAQDK